MGGGTGGQGVADDTTLGTQEAVLFDVTGDLLFQASVAKTITPNLQVFATGDASADFFNTAYLTLDIPDGVILTSASGVFLTEPYSETSVPEPASMALFGIGILGTLVVRRRRLHQ